MRLPCILLGILPAMAAPAPKLVFFEAPGDMESGRPLIAQTPQLTARFMPSGIDLICNGAAVEMRFLGTGAHVRPEGRRPLAAKTHFLIAGDSQRWRVNLATFEEIKYASLYPGIDAVYSGSGGRLKSEFRVSAGVDPGLIRMGYAGVDRLSVDDTGALVMATPAGVLRENTPEAYQDVQGRRVPVEVRFRINGDGSAGFAVGAFDRTKPLVIDPVLVYSARLGGAGLDIASAVATDPAGNAYVAGYTDSWDVKTGKPMSGTGVDAFVAKFSPDGSLVYCTYLGGNGDDRAFGIATDGSGAVYVAGWTGSTNFPVANAFQSRLAGQRDAFIAKLDPGGNTLLFSTYFGGIANDAVNGIAIDGAGNSYVAGETSSTALPACNGLQPANRGRSDAFVAKFAALGNNVLYCTHLGGTGDDGATGIAVDIAGNAHVTGFTGSVDFPTHYAFQSASGGNQDAFVTKLNATGTGLIYSTYLGGDGGTVGLSEMGAGIAVDSTGSAYVAGTTSSTNFPCVAAFKSKHSGGGTDAFLTKLNPFGSPAYSTYLGGSSLDISSGVAIDPSGSVYVAGYTASTDFPVINAQQSVNGGAYDAFVTQFSPDGRSLVWSTYLGGSESDVANAISVAGLSIYVVGQSLSPTFAVRQVLASPGGLLDGLVVRLMQATQMHGYLDVTSCDEIVGWAWDAYRPSDTVYVGIYEDTTLLATIPANNFRGDLLAAGFGNGYHGFRLPTPSRLKDGRPHAVTARFLHTQEEIRPSPRLLTCRTVEGVADTVNCSYIAGWAWDKSHPTDAASVDIYDGSRLLATLAATRFRPDLALAGIGTGYYGYYYPFPTELKDGKPHTIRTTYSGTNVTLGGHSTTTVTCVGLEGVSDTVNCSYMAGWAWDSSDPNVAVNIDILEGSTLLARLPANRFRPDLALAGIGAGYHGYYYPFPPHLKDGQPHTIRLMIAGTSIELHGVSGRSIACTP